MEPDVRLRQDPRRDAPHCYAETFAERFRGVPGHPYEQGFDLRLVPEKLSEPLKWSSPKMIFVNSMSDLFHEGQCRAPTHREQVARVMLSAGWHTFQVLTKRHERLRDLLRTRLAFAAQAPQIWWGVSVENRKHGLPRIEALREAPAAVRFLSIEAAHRGYRRNRPAGYPGSISAAKAAPARPMRRIGSWQHASATSAGRRTYPSSSNSGEASGSRRPGGC